MNVKKNNELVINGRLFAGVTVALMDAALSRGIKSLVRADIDTIDSVRYKLGSLLHERLKTHIHGDMAGLVVRDEGCAGLVCDALAANNGSSAYLRGAFVDCRPEAAFFDPVRRSCALDDFIAAEKLPGDISLVACGRDDRGSICVAVGRAGERLLYPVPALIQPLAKCPTSFTSVAMLGALVDWVSQTYNDREIVSAADKILKERQSREPAILAQEINSVTQCNKECAHLVAPQILNWFGGCLSVGESFTFGKVASLLVRSAENHPVEVFYGWYDARYKLAVGVPAENVTPKRIAEPDTVVFGARGLLNHLCRSSAVALATSGWASRAEGNADFFSVAALSQSSALGESVRALRMSVDGSSKFPSSWEKRELSRQLGVSASLFVLSDLVCSRGLDKSGVAAQARQRLEDVLKQLGSFQLI